MNPKIRMEQKFAPPAKRKEVKSLQRNQLDETKLTAVTKVD